MERTANNSESHKTNGFIAVVWVCVCATSYLPLQSSQECMQQFPCLPYSFSCTSDIKFGSNRRIYTPSSSNRYKEPQEVLSTNLLSIKRTKQITVPRIKHNLSHFWPNFLAAPSIQSHQTSI